MDHSACFFFFCDRVKVIFSDGKTKEADLVIGADGINSTVAKILLGKQNFKKKKACLSIEHGHINQDPVAAKKQSKVYRRLHVSRSEEC